VGDQAAEHIRPADGGAQNDRRAEGVPGHVRRGDTEVLDEGDKVVGVLEDVALPGRALALTVPPAIVREDLEGLR
jgi:hypothetical protein